jgi:hypothetical protein
VEFWNSYLERKRAEIALLCSYLSEPPRSVVEASVEQIVKVKFQLAAALKAEHALDNTLATETSWARVGKRCGPFALSFGYQRADLQIKGPSIYGSLDERTTAATYTSCGMSGMTALFFCPRPPERTVQAIGANPDAFQLCSWAQERSDQERNGMQIGLIDFCTPEETGEKNLPSCDALIVDTTCLAPRSARLRRLVTRSLGAGVPVILVRSHMKLDCLGLEYGRLGSVVFFSSLRAPPALRRWFDDLRREFQEMVRLTGAAAVPAHLPPFAGDARWEDLTRQRIAGTLRNTRFLRRVLAEQGIVTSSYRHGLYLLLGSGSPDLDEVTSQAECLAQHIRHNAQPVCHAGSFGFDFTCINAFTDGDGRHFVRVSPSDLPTPLMSTIATAIVEEKDHQVLGRQGCAASATPIQC